MPPAPNATRAASAAHPHLPPFEYRAIGTTRLWHGRNPLTAHDVAQLKADGITHVLDLREQLEWNTPGRLGAEAVAVLDAPETGITRASLPVGDGGIPSPETFDAGVAFLEAALAEPGTRVYVHCRLGRERTGALLAAYYAKATGTTAIDALRELNAGGAVLFPTDRQQAAAQEWINRRGNR